MLKRVNSGFLVGLYMLTILLPVLPILHYALNYDYYATVLCVNKDKPELKCNGKCHLAKKLKETARSTNQPAPEEIFISVVSVHSPTEQVMETASPEDPIIFCVSGLWVPGDGFIRLPEKPPQG